ncbi:MAG: Glu/Leu/Phe/Val family dehydrogenase [Rhizobiaceae bacterium]
MLQMRETRNLRNPKSGSSLVLSDITARASSLAAFDNHEQIWLGEDAERGLTAIVAIHDTTLGPALGGTRVWPHENFDAALTDALRLSRGMTLKSAVAGMPFGGGKAVIIADSKTEKTPALLEAYAEMLLALNGQYFTGEDVGLTLADADFLRERTPNVTGTTKGGSGNPSPVTAHGVFLGLKAALAHRRGTDRLAGIRVAVQGLGSVGRTLADKLHAEGATLIVADIDANRVRDAVETLGAEPCATDAILKADADVLAPCALGGLFDADTIPLVQAEIVAGAANNQLARHEDARLLMERGILYVPDYVINAGGLINVAAELAPGGYDRADAMARVARIPEVLADIFRRSDDERRPTNDIAQEIAAERLAASRG